MKPAKIISAILIFASFTAALAQKQIISTDNAPKAIGPYSQAVKVGNSLYLSGQIPLDPETGKVVEGGIVAQTYQSLRNIKSILEAADYSLDDVVQCQIFLADLNDYSTVNEIYATYFSKDFPVRAVVEVKRIPRDALIEIMVIAQK